MRSSSHPLDVLGEQIAATAAQINVATHALLTQIRLFDEKEGWARAGALSCAHWLGWRIGLGPNAAREKVRVAHALGGLPLLDEALRTSTVSYSKVRALTRIASPKTEEYLLSIAKSCTAHQLETFCRKFRSVAAVDGRPADTSRWVRKRTTESGMVRIEAQLSPEEAALVMKALDAAREALGARRGGEAAAERPAAAALTAPALVGDVPVEAPGAKGDDPERLDPWFQDLPPEPPMHIVFDENDELVGLMPIPPCGLDLETDAKPAPAAEAPWPSRAEALLCLAESFLAGNAARRAAGERWTILVHLGAGDEGASLEDGTRVSAETLRRIACDAGLVPVAEGPKGETLDVGRRTRSIPPAIRRALGVRDRGCRFPGCTNTLFVEAHHVRHWMHGGATALDNLVLLCGTHHRLVHEEGFTVARDDGGHVSFRDPRGTPVDAVPAPIRLLVELEPADPMPVPNWDGERIDNNWVVDAMLAAARSAHARGGDGR